MEKLYKTRPGADCGSDHELLITKFRLKLKNVGKIARPFRYVFITSTIVWSQVKQQGGNTTLPIDRKLDSRFTEHGPAHENKTRVSPTVSLSHQEASISLLYLSIRGQT